MKFLLLIGTLLLILTTTLFMIPSSNIVILFIILFGFTSLLCISIPFIYYSIKLIKISRNKILSNYKWYKTTKEEKQLKYEAKINQFNDVNKYRDCLELMNVNDELKIYFFHHIKEVRYIKDNIILPTNITMELLNEVKPIITDKEEYFKKYNNFRNKWK